MSIKNILTTGLLFYLLACNSQSANSQTSEFNNFYILDTVIFEKVYLVKLIDSTTASNLYICNFEYNQIDSILNCYDFDYEQILNYGFPAWPHGSLYTTLIASNIKPKREILDKYFVAFQYENSDFVRLSNFIHGNQHAEVYEINHTRFLFAIITKELYNYDVQFDKFLEGAPDQFIYILFPF